MSIELGLIWGISLFAAYQYGRHRMRNEAARYTALLLHKIDQDSDGSITKWVIEKTS